MFVNSQIRLFLPKLIHSTNS
uniref:Uncharacterized protein n=1 Tax=Rhizophora mucronata TaxID=61149 RepID=A0A2P2PBI9_RHIMU